MNDSIGEHAIAMCGEKTVAHNRPLGRAKAISGLISEEALASERLGRLTDKVAAALLDANLFSIRLPQAGGSATRAWNCSRPRRNLPRGRLRGLVHGDL
jgi:hypothetical protein